MHIRPHSIGNLLRGLFGCLVILLLAQVLLVPVCAAMTPEQAQQTPDGKFIQDLGNKAINVTVDKSLTPTQLDAKYDELLNGAFDMQTIGEFVIGRVWLRITPEQKQEYLNLFQKLVLKIYGGRMHFYSGEGFHVTDIRPQSTADTVVNTEIIHSDGSAPTPIDWTVRDANGKLAILDVSVDGVSQSVTERDEFADILARNGENFDALLNVIRQKVRPGSDDNAGQ
jgi:phospholipid transport system substrate-binding protein